MVIIIEGLLTYKNYRKNLPPCGIEQGGISGVYLLEEWQEPLIGQFEHPQPQEDFPFFLLRIMFATIRATITISTAQTMIVPMFPASHVSILFTSL